MTERTDRKFRSLRDKVKGISALERLSGVLEWDTAVAMPSSAGEFRERTNVELELVLFERFAASGFDC